MLSTILWGTIPDLSDSQKWSIVRSYRNDLLTRSDWTQLPDTELTDSEVDMWKTYRQSLRDLTDIYTNPDDVVFPNEPA